MDRPVDPLFQARQRRNRILVAIVAVAAGAGAIALSRSVLTPSVSRADIRTARVTRGAVVSGLEASGTVVPALETIIASPLEARVTEIIHQAGAVVGADSEIVRLDSSEARLALERLEEQLAQKLNERRRIGATLDETVATLAGNIEEKKLDFEILGYKADQSRALRSQGLISEEALRQSTVAARKAEIELEQLARRMESSRRTAAMDQAGLDLEIDVLRKEIEQSRELLGRATARSDRQGVVTWVIAQEGAMVRRGDPLARVADLDSLRIAGTISDVHAEKVRVGIPVRVRAGESRLEGLIAAIDPTIEGGVIRFSVELESKDHSALRNNQRVDLDLLTTQSGEGLRLPRADYGVAAGDDVVFRIVGDVASRTPVRFGRSDAESVEVIEGLSEGDEVVVSGMDGLWHASRVKVER